MVGFAKPELGDPPPLPPPPDAEPPEADPVDAVDEEELDLEDELPLLDEAEEELPLPEPVPDFAVDDEPAFFLVLLLVLAAPL